MNAVLNHQTKFIDLGLIDYQQAWDYQTNLFNSILEIKSANRVAAPGDQQVTENYLLFCEHPHVYTLGKSGNEENLLVKKEELPAIGATYFHINRGGDITYHGPGQLVGYPILDLENFFTDIHQYMRLLEEAVIQTLAEFNIVAGRIKGLTGVWLDVDDAKHARKICAMGVKTSRWVTLHGFALNVNTDLSYFDKMIPCGISDKAVTSMQKELDAPVDMTEVKNLMKEKLAALFKMDLLP
ncbi:MAG TPA: lipoyl(octanoyl) transferase LipB [Cyclobacteriaceae bacterium]|nr:lipoyl(octanoyl) transferase LipB [Cyclobacteriaceae bacterium]HMV07968.1 lipoyl(octanoyl) transferase LipB [Cyclobacteriaceae bacterium]HMV88236.1 lipoyl(octanoyl) transferase LipB [Cyclobacteriaceae bacterium]HMW99102.1 lipoyl(octanoyl) transferase LipB [Cyclobacteriaceae bacterium]HMX48265.1 lipoyl(octanoyl) transferase LipB [Cyclobacteriaceae bacterium]